MPSLDRFRIPHVFVMLLGVILFSSLLTWIVPSGRYERQTLQVGPIERNVIVPGSYAEVPKHYSVRGAIEGEASEGAASPVSLVGFLSAVPRGMEAAADIIFFVFVLGGVFGILQRTGTIVAGLQRLLTRFRGSGPALTVVLMTAIAIGGSTLGMGEEFIPLVPLFLIVSKELGYDRVFGLSLVFTASAVGFAAATTNPFSTNIAQSIAELEINSLLGFRLLFFASAVALMLLYILRYGARVKRDRSLSVMPDDTFEIEALSADVPAFDRRHATILWSCLAIFVYILYAVQAKGWWMAEMGGGFLLMGIVAIVVSGLPLGEAARAAARGMEDMVVGGLAIGFARAVQVVLDDGQILDTVVYAAASGLQHLPSWIAAAGMLTFQTGLAFFIPSASGQAAVTMPIMAPLADVLGLTRQVAIFAYTCGNGFANLLVPTSGLLMAMLGLAGIPYEKWLRFILPLFGWMIALSAVFLFAAVALGLE